MPDLDFLSEGLTIGANLALSIAEQEKQQQRQRQFMLERDRAARLHDLNMLSKQNFLQRQAEERAHMRGLETERLGFIRQRQMAREQAAELRPGREAQADYYRQMAAGQAQRQELAPYSTALQFMQYGFQPEAGTQVQPPGAPFPLEWQQPQAQAPDTGYLSAMSSLLAQARQSFENLLKDKQLTVEQMVEMRQKNPELFEKTRKGIPVLRAIPVIGGIFGHDEEAAFDYFIPDESGLSQADRHLQEISQLQQRLAAVGGTAMGLMPGTTGPLTLPETAGAGGQPPPGPLPYEQQDLYPGIPEAAAPGAGAGLSREEIHSQVLELNQPTPETGGDLKLSAGEVKVGVTGRSGKITRQRLTPFEWGKVPPDPAFDELSRRRWPEKLESAIEERIAQSIMQGDPVGRAYAIYEIWKTVQGEDGRKAADELFNKAIGDFSGGR